MEKIAQNSKPIDLLQEQKTPDTVVAPDKEHEILLVNIRKECIKLSHSAAKSAEEIINEAELFTHWVMTGARKEITPAQD